MPIEYAAYRGWDGSGISLQTDSLQLQEGALDVQASREPADPPPGGDDPVSGHGKANAIRPHRPPDGSSGMRMARPLRHLAVGYDPSPRNPADDAVHGPLERGRPPEIEGNARETATGEVPGERPREGSNPSGVPPNHGRFVPSERELHQFSLLDHQAARPDRRLHKIVRFLSHWGGTLSGSPLESKDSAPRRSAESPISPHKTRTSAATYLPPEN